MSSEPLDTIAFTQRLVELIDSGRRVSTYKLATLMALVDVCVENRAADDGTLAVPVQELAHRIVAYYWPQVRPYAEHGVLSQNHSGVRSIPALVAELRTTHPRLTTAEAAREDEDPDYVRLIRRVELVVAQQPLTHFHTVAGRKVTDQDFVFDSSGFRKKMTRAEFSVHSQLVLRPGVPAALRAMSALLKSFIKNAWTADVVRLNRTELDAEDIDGFLFGTPRGMLTALVAPLRDLQSNRCFYCERKLSGTIHIDHVLPWSRIPIDGIANLVAADAECNLQKSASVPIRSHLRRAVDRSHSDLSDISRIARIPLLHRRTVSASQGLYASLPEGLPLWVSPGHYEPFVGTSNCTGRSTPRDLTDLH